MESTKRISFNPDRRSGQPCIRNLRITVGDILSYLAAGMAVPEILADFPELNADDIQAALEYAANQINQTTTLVTEK